MLHLHNATDSLAPATATAPENKAKTPLEQALPTINQIAASYVKLSK
jgi:hypothetical protein